MTPTDYLRRIDDLVAAGDFLAIAALFREHDRTVGPRLSDDEFAKYTDLMELVDQIVDPVGPATSISAAHTGTGRAARG